MSTIFMKSENSKTYDAYRLRLNLTDKMGLSRGDRNAAITRCSVKLRDGIYVKAYGSLSFSKNMGKTLSNRCE